MLNSPEARRLMTVPGVNLIATAPFLAAIGEVSRFSTARTCVYRWTGGLALTDEFSTRWRSR